MTEWAARLSATGEKVLCGRPTGMPGGCDGYLGDVRHNTIRRWITLRPEGARAKSRQASGQTAKSRLGGYLVPMIVDQVIRRACPSCGVTAVIDPKRLLA